MIKEKIKTAGDDYLRLVQRFPLRPIRGESEYDCAVSILKELLALPRLTPGKSDYADALGYFVDAWESRKYPLEHTLKTPLQRLKYLMREHGMKTAELGKVLGSGQGQASLILNGRRELSKANIRTLAKYFKVSPALFI